jgi:hypothetical protein
MNTGWAEWVAAGLPTHANEQLASGVRCTCSLHADLVAAAPGEARPAP